MEAFDGGLVESAGFDVAELLAREKTGDEGEQLFVAGAQVEGAQNVFTGTFFELKKLPITNLVCVNSYLN